MWGTQFIFIQKRMIVCFLLFYNSFFLYSFYAEFSASSFIFLLAGKRRRGVVNEWLYILLLFSIWKDTHIYSQFAATNCLMFHFYLLTLYYSPLKRSLLWWFFYCQHIVLKCGWRKGNKKIHDKKINKKSHIIYTWSIFKKHYLRGAEAEVNCVCVCIRWKTATFNSYDLFIVDFALHILLPSHTYIKTGPQKILDQFYAYGGQIILIGSQKHKYIYIYLCLSRWKRLSMSLYLWLLRFLILLFLPEIIKFLSLALSLFYLSPSPFSYIFFAFVSLVAWNEINKNENATFSFPSLSVYFIFGILLNILTYKIIFFSRSLESLFHSFRE